MRITRVFFDTHMALGFDGLREIAKKAKTKVDEDSTLIFINSKMTAFKLFRAGQYIVYFRSTKKIPLDALSLLPSYFGGTQTEMDKAIKESLEKKLGIS